MKTLSALLAASLIAVSLTSIAWAEKTASDIPPGIAIPDEMDTRLGKLTFVDGAPSDETVKKVFDNLDFTNALNAYTNGYQLVSLQAMHR